MISPPPLESWELDTKLIGRQTLRFSSLSSTSDLAASLASDETRNGIAILADEQMGGRGQHGRVWAAKKGHSVLLSVLLFPPAELRKPALLTAWAAVSVANTVESILGIRPGIKWPNDILIEGKKLCGILIEQGLGLVVGIGLNVSQSAMDFSNLGLPDAISLQSCTPYPLDCQEVAKKLLGFLDDDYQLLLQGDTKKTETNWANGIGLVNKEVLIEEHRGLHRGKLVGLTLNQVEIQLPSGIKVSLAPEKISHIHPYFGTSEES